MHDIAIHNIILHQGYMPCDEKFQFFSGGKKHQLSGHFIGQTVLTGRKFQILGNKEIFQFSKFPWVLLEPVFSMSLIAD